MTFTTTAPVWNSHDGSMYHMTATDSEPSILPSQAVRLAAREGTLTTPTSGLAAGYLQANLIVLPSKYASDFRNLCFRNPVPCPLLAESSSPGRYDSFRSYIPGVADTELFTSNVDIRTDIPRYNVYQNGKLQDTGCTDIKESWTKDSVAFLIGCSFSFEAALSERDLMPNHIRAKRNVPMYRTNIPLNSSGVFHGSTYVVSMRSYASKDIEKVREITRPFLLTHGEPIDWGWDAVTRLDVKDIDKADFGDAPVDTQGNNLGQASEESSELPVFWGCGVTPQEAVMKAGDRIRDLVMAHLPGHMLLLDVEESRIKQA